MKFLNFLKELSFYLFCFLFAYALDVWMAYWWVKRKLGFKMDYDWGYQNSSKTA